MFIAVIDATLMNVAVPAIVSDLDTTVPVVQGAIAVYSLVMAALMLPAGKLPSRYGVRRLMQGTLVVYTVGTLLAAVSWSPAVLYFGWSIVEGAAAAVLMPLTFTVLVVTYEGKDRAKALGLLAGVNATGAAIGPILGGALTTFASWRWGFALEAVVVLVALVFVRYVSAAPLTQDSDSLDIGGTALSMVGATSLVVGLLLAGKFGWLVATRPFVVFGVQFNPFGTSPAVWVIGLGLLAFAAFTQYELRLERAGGSPLVPMEILTNRPFVAGSLTFGARSLVMAGFIFVIPVYLQSGLGYTAFEAGVAMLPFSIGTLLVSTFTTGWSAYVSPKILVQTGIVLMGVGLLLLFQGTTPDQTVRSMAPPMAVIGVGVGLLMPQLVNTTLSAVSQANSSEASGVMNATGMLGYALGTAVVGAFLLGQFYRGVIDGVLRASDAAVSVEQRDELARTLQQASETATEATRQAFITRLTPAEQELLEGIFKAAMVDAQRATLLLLVVFVLLTLVTSAFIPRDSGRP
ncbi:MFS transporter [Natronoarchaeum sp. GCM10025321]|uniref:MFS transporter n=1 Tax=Natronoarchaeum sp. GCM10025321 TaxID=3252684 RepID=UPI00360AAFD3